MYRQPIIEKNKGIPFRIDGIYVPKVTASGFLFYKNGYVKKMVFFDDFWDNPDKEWSEELKADNHYNYLKKNYWGHYAVKSDTITIQVFNWHNQEMCKRWVHEFKGIIVNDSTISIYSWYSNRSGIFSPGKYLVDRPYDAPYNIYFYPTSIKPDSTNAWFNNRRWYKRELHESRK